MRECETNIRDREAEDMQRWLLGLNTLVKCEKNYNDNSMCTNSG